MSNANRDYAIVYDVKNSLLILSRPLIFYITDKNTSNIFVKLVTKINVGNGIDQYTDIESASSYVLTMRVIKPDDEVKSLIATQCEEESIFQFDLTEDFKDIPGKYICELTVSNIVNKRQEFITSDPFNYEIKRSILSNVKNIIEGKDTTVEKLLNDLDATKAELSSQIKERAAKSAVDTALKDKVNTSDFQTALNNIGTMSPKGVYSNIQLLEQAYPSGSNGIYLTSDNGKWNYWDGTQWVPGGVYEKNAIDNYSITNEKIKTPYQQGFLTHGYFEVDTSYETITPRLESTLSVMVMTVPSTGIVTLSLEANTPIQVSFSTTKINQIFYDMNDNSIKVAAKYTDIPNYNSNLIYLGAIYKGHFYGTLNRTRFKLDGVVSQDNKEGYIFNGFINFDTNTGIFSITGNKYFTGNPWIYTTTSGNIELEGTQELTITDREIIQHIVYDLNSKSLKAFYYLGDPSDSTNYIYICSIYQNKILPGINEEHYRVNGIDLKLKKYGVANVVLGSININTIDGKLEFTNGEFGFYLASNTGQYTYKSTTGEIEDIAIDIDTNRFNTLFYDTEENTFNVSVQRKKETDYAIATFYSNKFVWSNSANISINKVMNNPFAYKSSLANETITCIGDSMTRGYTLPIEKSWVQLIGNRNNATMINMGISGCCLSANPSPGTTVNQSIIRRITNIPLDSDRVIVYPGYNDAFLNIPLGEKDSRDEKTFYGALNIVIEYLQTNFTTKKIGFITPFKFQDKFEPYINAIVEKCEENNIKVFKNHLEGGINYKNPKHVELLTMGDVHLSVKGLELVSYKYEDFIKSL